MFVNKSISCNIHVSNIQFFLCFILAELLLKLIFDIYPRLISLNIFIDIMSSISIYILSHHQMLSATFAFDMDQRLKNLDRIINSMQVYHLAYEFCKYTYCYVTGLDINGIENIFDADCHNVDYKRFSQYILTHGSDKQKGRLGVVNAILAALELDHCIDKYLCDMKNDVTRMCDQADLDMSLENIKHVINDNDALTNRKKTYVIKIIKAIYNIKHL